jgi:hypothetical protein
MFETETDPDAPIETDPDVPIEPEVPDEDATTAE